MPNMAKQSSEGISMIPQPDNVSLSVVRIRSNSLIVQMGLADNDENINMFYNILVNDLH